MTDTKRAAIATFLGILTGVLCISMFLLFPPAGVRPESGVVAMIFYSRLLQGFVIGIAEDVPLHPAARGALMGFLFSLLPAIVPLHAGNAVAAALLVAFGMIYGVVTDVVATWGAKGATEPSVTEQGGDKLPD